MLRSLLSNATPKAKFVIFAIPISIILIIIISVIFLIISHHQSDPSHINITNFTSITKAPDIYKTSLEDRVWQTLLYNKDTPLDTYTDAEIRADSYYAKITDKDQYQSTFILDIPSLQQSFDITLYWSTNADTVRILETENQDPIITITCPTATQIIYPDNTCIDSNEPASTIRSYLPFNGKTSSGVAVNAKIPPTYSKDYTPHIVVTINSCEDQALFEEGKKLYTDWLNSHNFSLDDFYTKYNTPCNATDAEISQTSPQPPSDSDYLLPYTNYDDNHNVRYAIQLEGVILKISTQSCNDPALQKTYHDEAMNWLTSHPIDPNDFIIIDQETCDGAAK